MSYLLIMCVLRAISLSFFTYKFTRIEKIIFRVYPYVFVNVGLHLRALLIKNISLNLGFAQNEFLNIYVCYVCRIFFI